MEPTPKSFEAKAGIKTAFARRSWRIFAFLLCLTAPGIFQTRAAVDVRVMLYAKINGQPARLAFDTGSGHSALFREAAARLGVHYDQSPPSGTLRPGEIFMPESDPFKLTLGEKTVTTSFGVLDPVMPVEFDGILAWGDVRSNIVEITGQTRSINVLNKVPREVKKWAHWKLVEQSSNDLASAWLGFQTQTNCRSRCVIYLDTGDDGGVRLCAPRFQPWRAANPAAPATLKASYYPGLADGLVVREECWATNLDLARSLQLAGVPVSVCTDSEDAMEDYEAALGLFALTRLDVVVDGIGGEIYLLPVAAPTNTWTYNYNRIGAVFTPRDIRGGDLIAKVIPDSPAYNAGVRDGDVLTKIGELDATQWKTDPRILPLSRFWSRPAGTKIAISCRRGDTNLDFSITLKEIFPPGPTTAGGGVTAK